MIKNILIFLGAVVTIILLCIAGAKFYIGYQAAHYDVAALPFLQKAIPEISTWQEEVIRRNMSEEVLQKISPENFSAIVEKFSRLGALKSFTTPCFEEVSAGNTLTGSSPTTKTIIYTSEAVYENGEATITLNLSVNDEKLELSYFNIQSQGLLDQ